MLTSTRVFKGSEILRLIDGSAFLFVHVQWLNVVPVEHSKLRMPGRIREIPIETTTIMWVEIQSSQLRSHRRIGFNPTSCVAVGGYQTRQPGWSTLIVRAAVHVDAPIESLIYFSFPSPRHLRTDRSTRRWIDGCSDVIGNGIICGFVFYICQGLPQRRQLQRTLLGSARLQDLDDIFSIKRD